MSMRIMPFPKSSLSLTPAAFVELEKDHQCQVSQCHRTITHTFAIVRSYSWRLYYLPVVGRLYRLFTLSSRVLLRRSQLLLYKHTLSFRTGRSVTMLAYRKTQAAS